MQQGGGTEVALEVLIKICLLGVGVHGAGGGAHGGGGGAPAPFILLMLVNTGSQVPGAADLLLQSLHFCTSNMDQELGITASSYWHNFRQHFYLCFHVCLIDVLTRFSWTPSSTYDFGNH